MIVLLLVMFPIILGLLLPFLKLDKMKRDIYVVCITLITSIISLYVVYNNIDADFIILSITKIFDIGFINDGLTKIFTLILAVLWPLATLYATEYMEHEGNEDSFFRYYLVAFGIAIGVAFSRNLITMYLFYELLTFLTLPLVMHKLDEQKSMYAGKVYLIVSILGAATALMGIIIFSVNVGEIEFKYSGLINNSFIYNKDALYISYLLMFIGFGVKAAIIPFTFWLPTCSVAPTPVSALLHAVAVVKAGVFAIIRATYYSYGTEFLKNSYAENIALIIAVLTVLYGSVMAIKEKNIKRRLAYSTASNLSYILIAVLLMSESTFAAGLIHMIFHAIIKINLFFVAGNMIIYANVNNVDEVSGLSKKMPISMISFLISSLALIGVPVTCGFISKYSLITSAINEENVKGYIGIFAIITSSVFTVIYLFKIIVPAYFEDYISKVNKNEFVKEAGLRIKFVLIVITFLIIYFGVNSTSLTSFVETVAKGS